MKGAPRRWPVGGVAESPRYGLPVKAPRPTDSAVDAIGRCRAAWLRNLVSYHWRHMQRTYAIGDIHGCLDKLQDLVKRCQLDAAAEKQTAKFVFLGDYIDRGPDSRGVVEFLINLQSQQPDLIICLAGNHEELALAAHYAGQYEIWLRNGGDETLRSYGITQPPTCRRIILLGLTLSSIGMTMADVCSSMPE